MNDMMNDNEDHVEPRQGEESDQQYEEDFFDTMSINSSITKYRVENGRTYHAYKNEIYWQPNDDQ